MTAIDYLELADTLIHAHAERLANGETGVTVETVLIDAHRCPCGGPLLHVVGGSARVCAACGCEVAE